MGKKSKNETLIHGNNASRLTVQMAFSKHRVGFYMTVQIQLHSFAICFDRTVFYLMIVQIDSNDVYSESSDESLITVLTTIPREKGLDAQNFRCPSCRKSIGPTFALYRYVCYLISVNVVSIKCSMPNVLLI